MQPGKLSQRLNLEKLKGYMWEIGPCGNKNDSESGKHMPGLVWCSSGYQSSLLLRCIITKVLASLGRRGQTSPGGPQLTLEQLHRVMCGMPVWWRLNLPLDFHWRSVWNQYPTARLSWEHPEAPVWLGIFQTNSPRGKCAECLFSKIVLASFMQCWCIWKWKC